MNGPLATSAVPPVLAVPSTRKTLYHLFLTLFLRGHSARGLRRLNQPKSALAKFAAPKSVVEKLTWVLIIYFLLGGAALAFVHQPVFGLAVYLHAMTFVFLGMFVASAAGSILFNKEEADILLHRPILTRDLLWAKVRVLVEVSLWIAAALNFIGLFIGVVSPDGGWHFPVVHVFSTMLEALFCTGAVVVTYQLCLRWCGRERLEGLMTTAQVLVTISAMLAGQILPRVAFRLGATATFSEQSWWLIFLPPAWFAGLDDALAGSGDPAAWVYAAPAVIVTGIILWLAFGTLARDYETGLQALGETTAMRPGRAGRRRLLDILVNRTPLRWILRDSIARASFLLCLAYLVRDRDTKLRVYPTIASMLILPIIFMFSGHSHDHGFSGTIAIGFAGAYTGLIPMQVLQLLEYSQQWQAADIFRSAPMPGPGPLMVGARWATMSLFGISQLAIFTLAGWLLLPDPNQIVLLLPGAIALPCYTIMASRLSGAAPLSRPVEDAKAANRGVSMLGIMLVAFVIAGLAAWSWSTGWFTGFISVEVVIAAAVYFFIARRLSTMRWSSVE